MQTTKPPSNTEKIFLNILQLIIILGALGLAVWALAPKLTPFLQKQQRQADAVKELFSGDFETGNLDGWRIEGTTARFIAEVTNEEARSGDYSLKLGSVDEAEDIRVIWEASVRPDSFYRFSGYIKANNVGENRVGGSLSIGDFYNHRGNVCGTTDWQYVESCFETGYNTRKATLAARIGMFCNTVEGTCYFDDLKLEQLESRPGDCLFIGEKKPDLSNPSLNSFLFVFGISVACLALVLILLYLFSWMKAKKTPEIPSDESTSLEENVLPQKPKSIFRFWPLFIVAWLVFLCVFFGMNMLKTGSQVGNTGFFLSLFLEFFLTNPLFLASIGLFVLLVVLSLFSVRIPQKPVFFMAIIILFVISVVFAYLRFLYSMNYPHRFRIYSPHYDHDLAPNVDRIIQKWGANYYKFSTNSLGFIDTKRRKVDLKSTRPRIVFAGDSFTECIGVSLSEAFIGILQKQLPKTEILDIGVSSYSPKLEYLKLKYHMDRGLEFDRLFILIDISDIQDEIFYYDFVPKSEEFVVDGLTDPVVLEQVKAARKYVEDNKESCRSRWTFDRDVYQHFGDLALSIARKNMDRIVDLCQSKNIQVTVVVYPWPEQISNRDEHSLQERYWQEYCREKNISFISLFPDFFQAPDALSKYFIPGDMHWNVEGHKLVAKKLLAFIQNDMGKE